MIDEDRGAGRPATINEDSCIKSYNLTCKQAEWIAKCARREKITASEFLRRLVKISMQKKE